MRKVRHFSIVDQVDRINRALRGHYGYYGIGGNLQSLHKVYRCVEHFWKKMLSSRSRAGGITWEQFHVIKERTPLLLPRLVLPYPKFKSLAVL